MSAQRSRGWKAKRKCMIAGGEARNKEVWELRPLMTQINDKRE